MALDWGINQLMLNAGQWAYGASRKMENNDVIVLAQASMARVADQIPASDRSVPILSSPRLGMERVRDVLNQLKSV
jgi:hypothetical protein